VVSDGGSRDGRLDVVAELEAHQQNLRSPPAPAHAALAALPLAPVCTLVAGDWFAAWRAATVGALAVELGGGDGPLPVLDLAGAEGSIEARLRAAWERGVRSVFVHGSADQPGLARALRSRWPGSLHETGAAPLDLLFELDGPVRWLSPTVARVAPGVPAPSGAIVVLAAVDGDADPRQTGEQGDHVWPYALDAARRLGVWSGALSPAGALGTAAGQLSRSRWDEVWSRRGHPDVVRMAALAMDPDLEAALGEPMARMPARRARIVAVTGLDGSGKSSHCDRLARLLRDRGASVRVLKLYRQGAFLELANELGARTRRGGPVAAFRTSRIVKLIDSLRVYRDHMEPALDTADVLVMDRYVETHIAAAASQLGWDLSGHPALAPFPAPDVRFWLEIDPDEALRRRDLRAERPTADEHATGLRGYAREFARLARRSGAEVRLDAAAAEEDNARLVAARSLAALAVARGPAEESRLTPPGGRPAAPATERCRVHLGPAPIGPSTGPSTGPSSLVELGGDLLSLRAAFRTWCGDAAGGAPEAFWLEAYAADLLLDLRVLAPAEARIALWPGALARMAGHADLPMLGEIDRMLAPSVEIASCAASVDGTSEAFVRLGAHRRAALRLARDYTTALDRLAGECGWPASR
jgi:thymidylate kinase